LGRNIIGDFAKEITDDDFEQIKFSPLGAKKNPDKYRGYIG